MDMQKTGKLIRRLREARGITQKALAETLHVTDKAVSKWERSLSCPDVALLEPLAGQLGISVAELLQGEQCGETPPRAELPQTEHFAGTALRAEMPQQEQFLQTPFPQEPRQKAPEPPFQSDGTNDGARRCAGRSRFVLRALQKYAFCICSLLFFAAGGICAVCDLAVFGAFTWSLIPIAALVFAQLVLFPLLRYGRKGVAGCLASLSLAIAPFLLCLRFCLNRLSGASPLFLPIGLRMAAVGLAFLWGIYLILHQLARRRMLALALCILLAVFAHIAVDFILSRLIQTPFLDGWDLFTIAVFLCAAALFLYLDKKAHLPRRYAENTGRTR